MNEWYLEPLNSQSDTDRFSIDSTSFTVGRSADNGLALDSRRVSRRHAVFVKIDNALIVRDLNSTNGTTINGLGFEGSEEVFHNDIVRFGDVDYRVVDQSLANHVNHSRPVNRGGLRLW